MPRRGGLGAMLGGRVAHPLSARTARPRNAMRTDPQPENIEEGVFMCCLSLATYIFFRAQATASSRSPRSTAFRKSCLASLVFPIFWAAYPAHA